MKFAKSFTIKGDSTEVFDETRKYLPKYGFKEEGASWPTHIVLKRGKGGLLKTNIKDLKTLLSISFKQNGDDVFVLCEYDIKSFGGMITASDKAVLEAEVEMLQSDLFGSIKHETPEIKVQTEKGNRRCEVCGSPVKSSSTFCGNCGRTVKPVPISIKIRGRDMMNRGVEVKFEPDRVKTGFNNLDLILYGGLPLGYAVVLTAPSSEERDLLIARILDEGVKQNEVTFVVSNDGSRMSQIIEKNKETFYAFICNPQADNLTENAPNVCKIDGCERLTELNIALSSSIEKIPENLDGPRRLILSNISDVLLSCHAQTTRKWLMELIPKMKAQNFTILAVLNPFMHPKEESHAIVDLFDGHIEMIENEADDSPMSLRMRKLFNQRYMSKKVSISKEDFEKNDINEEK